MKEGGVRRKRGERAAAVSYEITGGATIAALQGGRLAVGEGEKGRGERHGREGKDTQQNDEGSILPHNLRPNAEEEK